MSLTVAEKNHWKERLASRIDKRIEAIYVRAPHLRGLVERESRAAAIESLQLTAIERRLAEIEAASKQLEREERELRRAELALILGVPVEDVTELMVPYCGPPAEVVEAIERRRKLHAEQCLARDELGREIQRLELEKENLLDTIWLATSPTQLKQLWEQVNRLLGVTPTQLEQDALAIPPVVDP